MNEKGLTSQEAEILSREFYGERMLDKEIAGELTEIVEKAQGLPATQRMVIEVSVSALKDIIKDKMATLREDEKETTLAFLLGEVRSLRQKVERQLTQ